MRCDALQDYVAVHILMYDQDDLRGPRTPEAVRRAGIWQRFALCCMMSAHECSPTRSYPARYPGFPQADGAACLLLGWRWGLALGGALVWWLRSRGVPERVPMPPATRSGRCSGRRWMGTRWRWHPSGVHSLLNFGNLVQFVEELFSMISTADQHGWGRIGVAVDRPEPVRGSRQMPWIFRWPWQPR